MAKSKGNLAWGLGCALEVFMMMIVVTVLSTDQGVSLLLYMAILALPMAAVRFFLFSDTTPFLARAAIGPAGMVACLAAAVLFPIDVSETTDRTDGEITMEKPSGQTPEDKEADTPEKVLAELDELVGLEGVKAEVRKLVNLVKVNEARRKQGMKVPKMTYHMVFTGNPGTGKTTVARLVARVFRCLGIVEKGQLVETDRSGLVGRYAGETAVKTGAKIDEAMGGILFVDEAYQLASGDGDDYGK